MWQEIPGVGRLSFVEVYEECDGPRLFACRSEAGKRYLVFSAAEEDGAKVWVLMPISDGRLADVRSGRVSLRDAVQRCEFGEVILATVPFDGVPQVRFLLPADVPDSDLPEPDTYLNR